MRILTSCLTLLENLKLRSQQLIVARARADHDREHPRLDHALHSFVQKRQLVRRDRKLHILRLTRLETDARKTLQLFDRSRHRTHVVTNVHLHDLVACKFSGIGYIYSNSRVAARASLLRRHFQIRISEGGVTQPMTKSEERFFVAEQVTAARRWLVIVKAGHLTNVARDRDGKLARGVVITKQNVSDCNARLLTQIPSLENRGHLLSNVIDRKRAAADQNHNHRLPCFHDRFDEIVLPAQQVETIAIAKVIFRPTLSRRLNVISNDDNRDVRILCSLHRFGNAGIVVSGITQLHVVFMPARFVARRDPATLRVIHSDPVADSVFDPLQDADSSRWTTTVFAQLCVPSIWANDSNRSNLVAVEGQKIIFVLQ